MSHVHSTCTLLINAKLTSVIIYVNRVQNITDQVFAVIRDMVAESGVRSVKMSDVRERCITKGFKPDNIDECVEEYVDLNVWQVNAAKTRLTFI